MCNGYNKEAGGGVSQRIGESPLAEIEFERPSGFRGAKGIFVQQLKGSDLLMQLWVEDQYTVMMVS